MYLSWIPKLTIKAYKLTDTFTYHIHTLFPSNILLFDIRLICLRYVTYTHALTRKSAVGFSTMHVRWLMSGICLKRTPFEFQRCLIHTARLTSTISYTVKIVQPRNTKSGGISPSSISGGSKLLLTGLSKPQNWCFETLVIGVSNPHRSFETPLLKSFKFP